MREQKKYVYIFQFVEGFFFATWNIRGLEQQHAQASNTMKVYQSREWASFVDIFIFLPFHPPSLCSGSYRRALCAHKNVSDSSPTQHCALERRKVCWVRLSVESHSMYFIFQSRVEATNGERRMVLFDISTRIRLPLFFFLHREAMTKKKTLKNSSTSEWELYSAHSLQWGTRRGVKWLEWGEGKGGGVGHEWMRMKFRTEQSTKSYTNRKCWCT